jgi:hypothetical protein
MFPIMMSLLALQVRYSAKRCRLTSSGRHQDLAIAQVIKKNPDEKLSTRSRSLNCLDLF